MAKSGKDVWFRKRTPPYGVGYGIANWKGVIATLIFIGLTAVMSSTGAALCVRYGVDKLFVAIGGIVGFLIMLGLFLWLIVTHSDR